MSTGLDKVRVEAGSCLLPSESAGVDSLQID